MTPRLPRGFGLVTVLFLLVVLSSLAVFITRISTAQHVTGGVQVLQARALFAAKAGVQWATYRAITDSACPVASFSLSEGAATGLQIDVSCTLTTHRVTSNDVRYYAIQVVASRGNFGSEGFVSRTLIATVAETL